MTQRFGSTVVGNEKLEDEGKSDQAKAAVKEAREKVKDAALKVKHAITDK